MNRAQERFGTPKPFVVKKVQSHLNAMAQDFIAEAPFAVLSTSSEGGHCDASPKGGTPGFVKVIDEKHLLIPDIAGNHLFQSYENIESNPHAALVFFVPGCDWTVRANGRASVVYEEDDALAGVAPDTFFSDDNTRVLQGLLIEVDEAYIHCPRALLFSKLWDTERIGTAREADANRYWMGRWRETMEAEKD